MGSEKGSAQSSARFSPPSPFAQHWRRSTNKVRCNIGGKSRRGLKKKKPHLAEVDERLEDVDAGARPATAGSSQRGRGLLLAKIFVHVALQIAEVTVVVLWRGITGNSSRGDTAGVSAEEPPSPSRVPFPWAVAQRPRRTWMIFGGKSCKTSSLTRRRRNGRTCLCSCSKARAPSSCALVDALASRDARIGLLYASLNWRCVPRKPGMRKSKSDHSSSALFWIGVPLRISRWLVCRALTACAGGGSGEGVLKGNEPGRLCRWC